MNILVDLKAFVIASEARQSNPLEVMDCHGLRPRNDGVFHLCPWPL